MALWGRSKKKKPKVPPTSTLPGSHSTSNFQSSAVPRNAPVLPPRSGAPNPAVYSNSPQGWGSLSPDDAQYQRPYQPIYVSNYYIQPPQSQMQLVQSSGGSPDDRSKSRLISSSVANLPNLLQADVPTCVPGAQYLNDGITSWHRQGTQMLNQSAALYDQISSQFNNILTLIDGERFTEDQGDQWMTAPPISQLPSHSMQIEKGRKKGNIDANDKNQITIAASSSNCFAKVNMYANSKLPLDLPRFKLYVQTFPLLCLAAQYSEKVYEKAIGKEREAHVDADWKNGTKAMVIKSVPMDDLNVIVFAIRGSQTFLDWAVNLNSAPSSPQGFLDDSGNFCHAGFLSVARKMIEPVATRLRQLLIDNPNRRASSLLITGHSAGGAVAALLYSHMLATSTAVKSELNDLAGYFKRIHCVTFGAPPISLLPLQTPNRFELRKSLFLSFVNEGDPVARADRAYVKSLIDLYTSAAPSTKPVIASGRTGNSTTSLVKHRASKSTSNLALQQVSQAPTWKVPPSTLSNAGTLVLLRAVRRIPPKDRAGKGQIQSIMDDGVQARKVTDEMLRGVVWGDPVCHMMKLYARRIEVLATNAVVGKG